MYTFDRIAGILTGQVLHVSDNRSIKHLGYDTRKFHQGGQLLFFAIRGAHNDGHKYLQEAFQKGCRCFVVEDRGIEQWLSKEAIAESNIIVVRGSIMALQELAAYHRRQFSIPVIGITGSNGKTIVKEWLNQLLDQHFHVHRSPRSYNSQIGVPLSVWELESDHEVAIIEAGISQPGEMEALEEVIQPNLGLFTNIGQAHQAAFDSMEQKVEEKLQLFRHCRELFYCRDYRLIHEMIEKQKDQGFFEHWDFSTYSWSREDEDAELTLNSIVPYRQTTEITAQWINQDIQVTIPYTDQASIENAINCWFLGSYMAIPQDSLKEDLKHLSPVEMRLEMKRGINGSTIINDTYNSDVLSLQIAIDLLNQQNQHTQKTVILSDILQSGRSEAHLYKEVGHILESKGIDRLIGIGPAIERQQQQIPVDKTLYPTTDSFLKDLNNLSFNQEAILIKGARTFRFENITGRLQAKAHQTVLSINLEALINNLNVYRTQLSRSTKVMVMVKAFSYGSGTYEIANTLQFHKADYLAVAYADSGIALRKAGINLPIMVMNPEQQAFQDFIDYHLEPEIFSLNLLRNFSEFADAYQPENPVPIHLKLDTGMHRLGFEEKDLEELIDQLLEAEKLYVTSIFSHLSASEAENQDSFTRHQIRLYEKMSKKIEEFLGYPITRHILNTSGIVRFPEAHYDMVRLGLGFYGIDVTGELQDRLSIPGILKTTISQIKHLQPGATIGYGRKGKVNHPMTMATIAIGYADGFSRTFSNGNAYVMINGKKAPVVGDVCMDMTMVDITGLEAKEGDEVTIFGDKPTIQELAEWSNTIPYEILTNVSQRVKRVYYNE